MMNFFDDLDNGLIGIYLEHNRNICKIESKYELSETLFAINEPFYMQTEKEALLRDNDSLKRMKRKRKKKNTYEELLTDSQKDLIYKILEKVKYSIYSINSTKELNINESDNWSAKQLADVALNINCFDYNEKLLSNVNDFPIISGDFVIPRNCSLMCCEVIEGLKVMQDYYKMQKFKISNNFSIVLDPPWITNKSVKRKHCYQTDNYENILEMCKQLDLLIQLFPKETLIKIAIWTTNKEKDFVIKQMLPILNFESTHQFIWHKITRNGQSVKLRGGLEYLIIASRKPYVCKPYVTQCSHGILVSVPSAIHSHKPPLQQLFDFMSSKGCDRIDENKSDTPVVPIGIANNGSDSTQLQLLSHSIYSPLNGLEIYARYLNVGFHSVGFECLKLQHYSLYNML